MGQKPNQSKTEPDRIMETAINQPVGAPCGRHERWFDIIPYEKKTDPTKTEPKPN